MITPFLQLSNEPRYFRYVLQLSKLSYSNSKFDKFTNMWLSGIEERFNIPSSIDSSPVNLTSVRGKLISRQTSDMTEKRRAAVLVPLCNRHGTASFLFTLRSDKVSTHKVIYSPYFHNHT